MKLKKQEFLALKQGTISVSEYQDKFIQLSRYAPADVADDEEKQDHFREGLIGPIKYQLMVHTFDSFQKMVDNAIMVEHAHKEMGEQKRKYESYAVQQQCTSSLQPPARHTVPHRRTGSQLLVEPIPASQPAKSAAANAAGWSVCTTSQFPPESSEYSYWDAGEKQ
jgi:hypothetical protein